MSRPARSPIAERPHRHAELLERLVDLLRRRAFLEQEVGLARRTASSMRLPMKPSHTPETTPIFLIVLASCMTVASTSLRGLVAAHDLQQPHHVGRAEEVQADHVLRALGEARRSRRGPASRCCVARIAPGLHDLVERA